MDDLIDDLRDFGDDDSDSSGEDDFDFDFDSDDIPVQLGQVIGDEEDIAAAGGDAGFLGMSPAERAFLSAMLFFNVLVMGIALLMATGRIAV